MIIQPFTHSVDDVLKHLDTVVDGLQASAIPGLQQRYGKNELPQKKRSLIFLFLQQFNNVLVYILIGALGLSIALPFLEEQPLSLESFLDAIAILAILFLNAGLGFLQEYRAEEAIGALQKLSSPKVRVRRDGKEMFIGSVDIVPGDIIIVDTGDRISADGRLMIASHLEVDESAMTGESLPVQKHTKVINGEVSLAERKNMVFAGTLVRGGSAEYVVTSIGVETEIGKIAQMVSETEVPETPLEKKMKRLSVLIGIVVIALCAAVIVGGILYKLTLIELLLIGASLAVSAVPEGLPAVVTICFALGVKRMVKLNALVRKLDALETLGSVTVICSDKTGTITENRMKVVRSWMNPAFSKKGEAEEIIAMAGASCNRAQLPDLGDPTELALLTYAEEKKVMRHKIDDEEVPFTSEGKYMQTRHGDRVFLKGAPEKILDLIGESDNKAMVKENLKMAKDGLRVLAFAIKEGKKGKAELIGLLGLEDPPRPKVKIAIEQAKDAGIRTVMITGDHAETAKAIAHQVGLTGEVMRGADIDELKPGQLRQRVKDISIYARVSPSHKLAILEALQENKHIVAMTGDGVNDAPALKGAHVGVAMGKNGTEVAREAASMVLLDDDYSTIIPAIREGRRIYDNIRKFVLFLLRSNFDEILFISTCIFLNIPLPYLPIHLLWINLMTDSLPALALGMERAEPNVMKRPPRNAGEHLLSGEWFRLFSLAIFAYIVGFIYYNIQLWEGVSLDEARTAGLMRAIIFELCMALSMRSKEPIFRIGFFSNPWMIGAVAITLVMQPLILYTPLAAVFHTVPLPVNEWVQIVIFALAMFAFFEVMKLVSLWYEKRKKRSGKMRPAMA